MNTLQALWRVIHALWNIAAPFARAAIRVVLGVMVVWPFVLLGTSFVGLPSLTAAMALVPLAAVILLMLIYPLVSGVLAAFPQGRTFYLWLAVALFGEMLIGLYLAVVPVWNWPELIPILALLVVVLGMFLILKWQFVWRWGWFVTAALTWAIVLVTIAFFFGGKKEAEARGEEALVVQPTPRVQEFTVNADEQKVTVLNGPGTFHRIRANKAWVAMSMRPLVPAAGESTHIEYIMPAGESSWRGGEPEGLLRVKGLEDGTTLRFERE